MKFFRIILLCISLFLFKPVVSQTKTFKYEIIMYSADEYDSKTKKWVEGDPVKGSSLLMVVFSVNENKIYLYWGEKKTFDIYNASSEKHDDSDDAIYKTLDEFGNEIMFRLMFFNDGSRMLKIEATGKIVYMTLKLMP